LYKYRKLCYNTLRSTTLKGKVMSKDEALKLALEALTYPRPTDNYPPLWRVYGKTINDAITAVSVPGKAGAEALQENTIIDLFGSKLRAEASVKRFAQSASLPRRIVDSVSQWATGEKTQLTLEDREAIVYAAMKMQEETINTAVFNSAPALGIEESLVPSVRAVYEFPSYADAWAKKFEEDYKKETSNNKTSNNDEDELNQYLEEVRRNRNAAR
jgi:hypothetical protein